MAVVETEHAAKMIEPLAMRHAIVFELIGQVLEVVIAVDCSRHDFSPLAYTDISVIACCLLGRKRRKINIET